MSTRYDGGLETDLKPILEVHRAYLDANAAFDWKALRPIWSDDRTNVFFNMNGHTYVVLEHWTRLYAIAGTLDECLERFRVYANAGVTELGLWSVGDRTVADVARMGAALR